MPSKIQSIVLAGLIVGVVSPFSQLIPTVGGCIACILFLGTGVIATWHYTSTHSLTIAPGTGAGIGALAGIAAALISAVVTLVFQSLDILPTVEDIIAQMEASGQLDDMPAEQRDTVTNMTRTMGGPAGYAIGAGMGLIFGALGGLIGAAMFKKGEDDGF
ncbi:MAG: hypothetical protein RhofKO_01450 [Rhodothermales bacterium]